MDIKIFTENIEGEALNQIYTLAKLDAFKDAKIRIMPDVHAGAGCVIGFTADLGDKVIPNIVGVDIGCGMRVERLGKVEFPLEKLDRTIKQNIPVGFAVHDKEQDFDLTQLLCYDKLQKIQHLQCSLGTLGGGNHFIEVDRGSNGEKFLVIHTGSRNLGLQVAKIYQKIAVEKRVPGSKIPESLCYLEGADREAYLHDMKICQEFAVKNREQIAKVILKKMKLQSKETFEVIHNYISFEDNIVRKGAISARYGEKVLIPLNMRDGCILGVGKGNVDWNNSAPHGAGRILSRSQAKKTLSLESFQYAMKGIYTTTANKSTIDEAPMAYKPAQEIIDNVEDSVEILDIIKPIYNFKAAEK